MNLLRILIRLYPFNKGKQTLAHQIFQRFERYFSGVVAIQYKNIYIHLDLKDRMQAIFYLTGLYEPQSVQLCVDRLPSNGTYIDVGANVGLYALQILARRPNLNSHLFEPDKNVFASLLRNVESNRFKNVYLQNKAVSCEKERQIVFVPTSEMAESGWGRLENPSNSTNSLKVRVDLITLDDYFHEMKIDHVDLLKIDVEGAEEQVLKGAIGYLSSKKIETILCEINAEALAAFGSSQKKLESFLLSFGYKKIGQCELNCCFSITPNTK